MATFTVTNLFDSGTGSFRQAIFDANATAGADEILFNAGLSGGTINLASGELLIADDLTINGLGADLLTVDAGGLSRVFNINDGVTDSFIDALIDGLTITGGGTVSEGGGIFNQENLTVTNSIISGNSANFAGGGINNTAGTLELSNSTISGNSADYGGGIYNGKDRNGKEGIFTVTNSTISGNESDSQGGGIFSSSGNGLVKNSTISSNIASSGGGIEDQGMLTLTNSTISANSATVSGGIIGSGNTTIENTIIGGNNSVLRYPDVEGNFISNGFNLISDPTGSTGFENDLIEPDITKILDTTLADNGGSTLTHALVPGSPAIDAGNNNDVLVGMTTDQRGIGFNRIVDGNNDTIAIVDIGAVEVQQPPSTSVPEPSSMLGLLGLVILGTGSLLRRKLQNKS